MSKKKVRINKPLTISRCNSNFISLRYKSNPDELFQTFTYSTFSESRKIEYNTMVGYKEKLLHVPIRT